MTRVLVAVLLLLGGYAAGSLSPPRHAHAGSMVDVVERAVHALEAIARSQEKIADAAGRCR